MRVDPGIFDPAPLQERPVTLFNGETLTLIGRPATGVDQLRVLYAGDPAEEALLRCGVIVGWRGVENARTGEPVPFSMENLVALMGRHRELAAAAASFALSLYPSESEAGLKNSDAPSGSSEAAATSPIPTPTPAPSESTSG